MSGTPAVTGISPKEGPPKTKIVIRGENLGQNESDLVSVTICGEDCTKWATWVTSTKITCQTGVEGGWGEVIVTTRSGGRGTCTVHFRGISPLRDAIDPLLEMDHWVDEPDDIIEPSASLASPVPAMGRYLYNPLGLSIDEAQSGRSKPLQADLKAVFPEGSSSLLSDNFVPEWLLIEKYRNVTFEDLKAGLTHLQDELDKRSAGTSFFIKDHIGSFIQCYDVLTAVNEEMLTNATKSEGGNLTDRAEDCLKSADSLAQKVYSDILSYRSKAETIRNALAVLQRYRFLFNLPKSIEKNISNGDYEYVANDYERAKQLFTGTKVNVFKRVLEQVEEQINEFRKKLKKKLTELPAKLDIQKKLIKYLLELDCGGDPAWECITNMHQWIIRLLHSAMRSYQTVVHVTTEVPEEVNEEDSKSEAPNENSEDTGSMFNAEGGDVEKPNRILFVEELTALVSDTLPDLWNLGLVYLSKSLYQDVGVNLSDEQIKAVGSIELNKDAFQAMVNEICEVYSDMVHLSFFPDHWSRMPEGQKDILKDWGKFPESLEMARPWLTSCVREIESALSIFQEAGLPLQVTKVMKMLLRNVREHSMETLFTHATREIQSLHAREDWKVQSEDSGCITSLPLLVENIAVELILTLEQVVTGHPEDMKDPLRDDSEVLFGKMLEKTIDCLSYLAFEQEEDLHEEALLKIATQSGSMDIVGSLGEMAEDSLPNSDVRLIIILSNCHYITTQVIPRVFDCFRAHGYPTAKKTELSILEQLSQLDRKLFDAYIERKQQPLLAILETGMFSRSSFDWEDCGSLREIRSYIRELLMTLVFIHNEVHLISPLFVSRVISKLVEITAHEMLVLLMEIEVFSRNGSLHAYAELTTLKETADPFITDAAEKYFSNAVKQIGMTQETKEIEFVKQLIEKFKKTSAMQLRCFKS